MRKNQAKEKQLPISQKVKKMFRYSPSYQAQKCYSKLPLKYSHASTRNNDTQTHKNSEMNFDYSSVKEKHFESNECNDTSSWIAKLVNGIQDQDQQNKMLNRLSQIENKSISDLPQDSQNEDDRNQFLLEKANSLFTQKQIQIKANNVLGTLFEKQTPITKPMKKSIKQTLIQIQMKENTDDGLRVPPVTRNNSCTKRENAQNIIKQKQNKLNKNKTNTIKNQSRKSFTTQKSRTSLLPQKPKSEVKIKNKTNVKNNENTFDYTETKERISQTKKQKTDKNDTTIEILSHKNSMVSSGTKKQSIRQLRYETEEYQTRKNSFIDGTYLLDNKQEFKIVDEHSKNLNIKNLFEDQKHFETKPCSSENLIQGEVIPNQKRIGSIKKNKTKISTNQNTLNYHSRNGSIDVKQDTKRNILNEQMSSIQLESNRNLNNFTLNRRSFQQNILVELSSNRIRSNRNNILQNLDANKLLPSNESKINGNRDNYTLYNNKIEKNTKNDENRRLNLQLIKPIFDKIRLDRSNPILSKNNLKLRGLTEQQKTQLGSIITKIHYQEVQYDIQAFYEQFTKVNYECSLKGCLSQQKLKKYHPLSLQKGHTKCNVKNEEKKIYENKQQLSFEGQYQKNKISSAFIQGIGHKRRTSNIIKKKLFNNQNNKFPFLQDLDPYHLQKQSEAPKIAILKDITCMQKIINQNQQNENDENISKEPYIEGSSLADIQLSKRDIPSSRTAASSENQLKKIDLGFLNNLQNTNDENGVCLIERLNKKLTNYIDKNQILSTYRQFNLNFSELKKHIR